jgi:hypothetical protein
VLWISPGKAGLVVYQELPEPFDYYLNPVVVIFK